MAADSMQASSAAPIDTIIVPPAISGKAGRAWPMDLPAVRLSVGMAPERDPTLAGWLVETPVKGELWHSYLIYVVHLRPLEGYAPRAHIKDASHEMALYALEPGKPRRLNALNARLHPPIFAAQWVATYDDAAALKLEKAVREMCRGTLVPATSHIRQWIARFGGAMVKLTRQPTAPVSRRVQ